MEPRALFVQFPCGLSRVGTCLLTLPSLPFFTVPFTSWPGVELWKSKSSPIWNVKRQHLDKRVWITGEKQGGFFLPLLSIFSLLPSINLIYKKNIIRYTSHTLTILIIFKCTALWHEVHPYHWATITTIHLWNFFIFSNWNYVPRLNPNSQLPLPLAPGNHHSPFWLQMTQLSGLIILGSIKILPLALDLLAEGSYLNGDTTDGDRLRRASVQLGKRWARTHNTSITCLPTHEDPAKRSCHFRLELAMEGPCILVTRW